MCKILYKNSLYLLKILRGYFFGAPGRPGSQSLQGGGAETDAEGCAPFIFRLDALALSVIATATWLHGWVAGWVAVTLRYCIKTAKPIGKLFRPSESSIILVF